MKMGNKYGGRTDLKVTSIDVCAGAYLLWGALNMLFIAQLPIDNILFWKWCLVACVYILVRSIPRKEYILWLLVLAGIIQSAYAIGQHIGYIASNHRLVVYYNFCIAEKKRTLPYCRMCASFIASAYRLLDVVSRLTSWRSCGIGGTHCIVLARNPAVLNAA